MKRIIAMLLCLSLILSFCACSKTDEGTDATATNSNATDNSQQSTDGGNTEDPLYPVTFTVFDPWAGRIISPNDAPIIKQMIELTGVTIEWILPPAEPEERLNIMLASGESELPDLIYFNKKDMMNQFIEADKLIDLEDLLKEHAPNTYSFNYQSFINKIRHTDGKMYYMPNGYDFGKEYDKGSYHYSDSGFSCRTGLLEELDWYDPKDFDAVHELLKIHKEHYPDMAPMALALGPQGYLDDLNVTGAGSYGLVYNKEDVILTEDNTLVYFSDVPEMKEWYRYLNMLYREGLIDPESPVMSKDMLKEKVLGGKVFSWFGPGWEIGTAFIANRSAEGDNEQVRYWFFPSANDSIEKLTYGPMSDNLYQTGVSITKACEDPARFMKFYEYINTEEGYWNARGIVDWDFTGENTPENTAGYDWIAKTDAEQVRPGRTPILASAWMGDEWGKDDDFHWKRGLNYYDMFFWGFTNHPQGKYDVIGDQDVSMWWDERTTEVQAAYGWTGKNYVSKHNESGCDTTLMEGHVLDPDSDEALIENKMKAYKQTQLPKIIVAKSEAEFDKLWQEMCDRFDADGKQKFLDKKNEMVQQRIEDWGLDQ